MHHNSHNIKHWRLDYGWAQRGGKWSEFTAVMLEGVLQGNRKCLDALRAWVSSQEKSNATLDGEPMEIFYVGGIQGYLKEVSDPDKLLLRLHSRGEDAFDSLSHYSQVVATVLRKCSGNCTLNWIEHRHDRNHDRLVWPLHT